MNNTNMQWLKDLGNDNAGWVDPAGMEIPVFLKEQYRRLREFACEGNLYGLMLQIRDIYETAVKIPCIISLSMLNEDEDDAQIKDKLKLIYKDILEKPLAMGDWKKLADDILKKEVISADPLIILLKKTTELFSKKISAEYPTITKWRNETIGHGFIRLDDRSCDKAEYERILAYLKAYFEDPEINEAYRVMFFSIEENRICGDETDIPGEADIRLNVDGNTYRSGRFFCACSMLYFFDSYYKYNKEAKFISYVTGRKLNEDRDLQIYFKKLIADYSIAGELLRGGIKKSTHSSARDSLLRYLDDDEDYRKPGYIVKKLQETMDAMGSGVIMLQMERGMGKTAFTLHADSDLYGEKLLKGKIVRTYKLSDVHLRGISHFIDRINKNLLYVLPGCFPDYYSSSVDSLSLSHEDRQADMINLLNDYDLLRYELNNEYDYQYENTVLILDGVDELSEEAEEILSFIPDKNTAADGKHLNDGVFIILTSRCANEEGLSKKSREIINKFADRADAVIKIKRDDKDYLEDLRSHVSKILPGIGNDTVDLIMSRLENRFLGCKMLRYAEKEMLSDRENWLQNVVGNYLDSIISARNLSASNELTDFLSAISIMGSISLEEYLKYFTFDDDISFSLIGSINDALPLLVTERRTAEKNAKDDKVPEGISTVYRWASEEYREYFMDRYRERMASFTEEGKSAIKLWYRLAMDELTERVKERREEDLYLGVPTDELSYFGDHDTSLFYMSFLNAVWNIAEERGNQRSFFGSEFFKTFCAVADHFLGTTTLLSYKDNDIEEIRYGFLVTYEKVLEYMINKPDDPETAGIFIECIGEIQQGITYCGEKHNRLFTEYAFKQFINGADPRWLDIIFNENKFDQEREGSFYGIKKAGKEHLLTDYILAKTIRVIKSSDSYDGGPEYDNMRMLIDDLLCFDLERDDRSKLQSIKVYFELDNVRRRIKAISGEKPVNRARRLYWEILDEGLEFIYFDGISDILSKDMVDEMLSYEYDKKEISESRSKIYKAKELDEGELVKSFCTLMEACDDKKDPDPENIKALRFYYDRLIERVQNTDLPVPDITDTDKLINRIFDKDNREIEKRRFIDLFLTRDDWHTDDTSIGALRELFATFIWEDTDDIRQKMKYLKKYLEELEPYFYFSSLMTGISVDENELPGIGICAGRPVCSPDAICYILKLKNNEKVKDIAEDIVKRMSESSQKLCSFLADNSDIMVLIMALEDRAALSCVCKRFYGYDPDPAWIDYLNNLCGDLIKEHLDENRYIDPELFEIRVADLVWILYVAGEYNKALEIIEKINESIPEYDDTDAEDMKKQLKAYSLINRFLSDGSSKEEIKALDLMEFTYDIEGIPYYINKVFALAEKIRNSIIKGEEKDFSFDPEEVYNIPMLKKKENHHPGLFK